MVLLLFIATVGRCASAELCPSDRELISALNSRDNAVMESVVVAERAKDPKGVWIADAERIKRVDDVHCGSVLPDTRRSMTCSFTVEYGGHTVFEVADLSWSGGKWTVTNEMAVTRGRK
jgi:hypothetical protein